MSRLGEIWKPAFNYEGWYEVSSLGRVKRIRSISSTWVGRILNPKLSGSVVFYTLVKNGVPSCIRGCRLVFESFERPLKLTELITFKDEDSKNISYHNLTVIDTNCEIIGEVWKPIRLFPNYYISSEGRVRSTKKSTNKLLTPHIDKKGYLQVALCSTDRVRTVKIHQLLGDAFLCKPTDTKEHLEIRHLDGNSLNNALSNLKWGTRKENQSDKVLHGRHSRGDRSIRSKLTWEQVDYIRTLPKYGRSILNKLKEKFPNVSKATFSGIRSNRRYKLEHRPA